MKQSISRKDKWGVRDGFLWNVAASELHMPAHNHP